MWVRTALIPVSGSERDWCTPTCMTGQLSRAFRGRPVWWSCHALSIGSRTMYKIGSVVGCKWQYSYYWGFLTQRKIIYYWTSKVTGCLISLLFDESFWLPTWIRPWFNYCDWVTIQTIYFSIWLVQYLHIGKTLSLLHVWLIVLSPWSLDMNFYLHY